MINYIGAAISIVGIIAGVIYLTTHKYSADQASVDTAEEYWVSGHVKDIDGHTLVNKMVYIDAVGGVTDENGFYSTYVIEESNGQVASVLLQDNLTEESTEVSANYQITVSGTDTVDNQSILDNNCKNPRLQNPEECLTREFHDVTIDITASVIE